MKLIRHNVTLSFYDDVEWISLLARSSPLAPTRVGSADVRRWPAVSCKSFLSNQIWREADEYPV